MSDDRRNARIEFEACDCQKDVISAWMLLNAQCYPLQQQAYYILLRSTSMRATTTVGQPNNVQELQRCLNKLK